MYEFFLDNTFALGMYQLVILLIIYSIFNKKLKGLLLILALVFFVIDISYLLILGFGLFKLSIITGISIIFILISIKEGTYDI